MNPTITELLIRQLEKPFINENFNTDASYIIRQGNSNVMISASHSVTHTRKGESKQGEYRTGVLTELLHQNGDCPIILNVKNNNSDPNHDVDCVYKQALIDHVNKNNINLLLDIHIMSSDRDHFLDIGTGSGQNLPLDGDQAVKVARHFKAQGIEDVKIDFAFHARKPSCVARNISEVCQIDALQLEINWDLFDASIDSSNFTKLYNAFSSIIKT